MNRLLKFFSVSVFCFFMAQGHAQQVVDPNAFVKTIANGALDAIKAEPKDRRQNPRHVLSLVEQKVFPYVDLMRMTQLSAGKAWREASEDQRQRLVNAFSVTLVRTYSTALASVTDNTSIEFKPFRPTGADDDALVQSVINNAGSSPIQIDYRLQKQADGTWKIYDVNVMGVWLVQNYRTQFGQQIAQNGMDSLITALEQKNDEYFQANP